eukprot:TRINITY_DN4066_c0_g1_i4.p1 TRINITY_DN4066_c0_g1~~TRINITY_DN4066_c0_g1_i4.p1  ORF type:complete len:510 (-),score=94.21 TRINITY_DN4066_c0_g1_i4:80-1609(-)
MDPTNYLVLLPSLMIVAAIFYKLIARPFATLLYYMKQGLKLDFYLPIFGFLFYAIKYDSRRNGDAFYRVKEKIKRDPKAKFYLTTYGLTPMIFLLDPTIIREFYRDKREFYSKTSIAYDLMKIVAPNGLINIEGPLWRLHRKTLADLFHFDFLARMTENFNIIMNDHFDNMVKKNNLSHVNILREFQQITGTVVIRVFIGVDIEISESLIDHFVRGLDSLTLLRADPIAIMFGSKFVKKRILPQHRRIMEKADFFVQLAYECIEKTQNKFKEQPSKNPGLIELLTRSNQEKVPGHHIFTKEEIKDEFITFFAGGMDTTAHLVTVCIYYVLENPHVLNKILEEVQTHIPDHLKISIEDLKGMEYLEAVVKETLRLFPPAAFLFPLIANQDHDIGGIHIKKGTGLNIGIGCLGIHPTYYQDPEVFRPERWLNPEEVAKIDPFMNIPFSSGVHNCIGQHLSKIETKLIIIKFLKKFEATNSDPNFQLKRTLAFTYEPLDPITLDIKLREKVF